ncbi:hypothetical protein [Streptodolium elevatio]
MSYAPPPGPHGGIPHQQQWGAAQPPPPQPYRGPARPRKLLVGLVGVLITVAALSSMAFTALWWDNSIKETGFTDTNPYKDLPAPRGLGAPVPGPADIPTGPTGGGA